MTYTKNLTTTMTQIQQFWQLCFLCKNLLSSSVFSSSRFEMATVLSRLLLWLKRVFLFIGLPLSKNLIYGAYFIIHKSKWKCTLTYCSLQPSKNLACSWYMYISMYEHTLKWGFNSFIRIVSWNWGNMNINSISSNKTKLECILLHFSYF